MARPLRLEYADAVHHVMSRGIEGRKICLDEADRDIWLGILGRAAERFGWKVYAFSLLDNPVSRAAHGLVLGSDEFVRKVRKMLSGRKAHAEVPGLGRMRRGGDLEAMVERLAKRLKADRSEWTPGRRDNDLTRAKCAYGVRQASGARNHELAAALGYRSPSAVSAACRLVREMARSAKAKREMEELVAYAAEEL
jgi:hypothetical protein